MANRKYTVGRPIQEVRLKNWPAGQVAQFKKAIELLENELNTAMASQIEQGAKRVVSARVPKVTGLVVRAGFKNFQISFNEAKGITDLLFYEIQKDNTSSFSDPTTYNSPQTTLTLPTAQERETIHVRVRVMNSKFQVGPWSTVVSVTGSGDFRISTIRGERTTLEIAPEDFNTWVDVQTISITVGTSAMSVSVQPGLVTLMSNDVTPPSTRIIYSTSHSAIFRLLKNGVELTNAGRAQMSQISSYLYQPEAEEQVEEEEKVEYAKFGVIISPIESLNNVTVSYTLQAYVNGASRENINDGGPTDIDVIDNPLVVVDTFELLELVQSL